MNNQTNKQQKNECAQTCNGRLSSLAYQFLKSSCNPNNSINTLMNSQDRGVAIAFILTFLLALTYDQLGDKRIDNILFVSLLYKTRRFHVVVRLFSN